MDIAHENPSDRAPDRILNAAAERDASAAARRAPLGVRFKFLYGAGALVEGTTTAALTFFLLFYLTSVCGLSGTAAGTALLVGLLIDAFADPIIGLMSDSTRSRLGRRYPYLLFSIVPLAIGFALLFSIPSSLGGFGLLAYATLCAMAVRIGQSFFNLPYVAVGAEVSDDYHERSSIVAYRISFSMLGTFAAISLGLSWFLAGPSGLLDRAAYVPFAWTLAAIVVVGGLAAAFATRGVADRMHPPTPLEGPLVAGFFRELRDVFRNRSFVLLFIAVLAFFVAQGMAGALAIHLNSYFWKLSAEGVQLILIGATLGPFIGAPLAAVLSRRIEKKSLVIGSFAIFILAQLWPPIAGIAGWMPTGSLRTGILFANAVTGGVALIGAAIGAQSMMADAADEHEHRFGVRREGLFFSGLSLAGKAAVGLGGFLAGTALDLIAFPSATAAKGQLSGAVLRDLGLIAGPLPALITLIAPLVLLGYGLTRKRHAEILAEIERRRG
jgi:GPH family glycoside/pentoside/hexuronide:cation symporter